MGTHEEKLAGTEPHRDNTLLCGNIRKMVKLIKDDAKTKSEEHYSSEDAYKDLGITYKSYRRWENEPNHLIHKRSLDPLFRNYNEKFLPPLDKPEDLIDRDITGEMRLINNINIDFLKLFCNTYNVYYYSAHGPEEIHFGLLRLFIEGESIRAKLVIGIPKTEYLHDPELNNVFKSNSNSFEQFKSYRKNRKRLEDRYCYYYYGTAEISAQMLILTMYGRDRNNRANDHKLKVLINIRKIIKRQMEKADNKPYWGGIGTALSMPNEKHMSLRIYRMGLSEWELPNEGIELVRALLRHNHAENHRIVMTEEDDRAWMYVLAKYQPQGSWTMT